MQILKTIRFSTGPTFTSMPPPVLSRQASGYHARP